MTLSERLKKGLIHTGVIPLAILLTGCPEKQADSFRSNSVGIIIDRLPREAPRRFFYREYPKNKANEMRDKRDSC